MTHGVISETAKLIYMKEPGAVNEAIADFFGIVISRSDEWAIGRALSVKREGSRPIRCLAKPSDCAYRRRDGEGNLVERPYPSHVRDMRPTHGACHAGNDNCWLHFNSTVIGHALYLVQSAVGRKAAAHLVYRTLVHRLTATSDFQETRDRMLEVCERMLDREGCARVALAFAQVGIRDRR
jgi:Zn-dependent metalloprotease